MTMRWDPDNASQFDVEEVQHEAVDLLFPSLVKNGRPVVAQPVLDRARDVVRVNDTGRRLIEQRPVRAPGLDRPDPAASLAWIGAFLCIVLALVAVGLATVVAQIALHWRGVLELALTGAWLFAVTKWCSRHGR